MSRMTSLSGAVLLLCLVGCPGNGDDDQPLADSGQCQCPTPTAVTTTYDNQSSQLGAENVQDALDELAARPVAEAPVAGRIEKVVMKVDNPGTANLDLKVSCPRLTDIAIGGGCGQIIDSGASLQGFELQRASVDFPAAQRCMYAQPPGPKANQIELSVLCLKAE